MQKLKTHTFNLLHSVAVAFRSKNHYVCHAGKQRMEFYGTRCEHAPLRLMSTYIRIKYDTNIIWNVCSSDWLSLARSMYLSSAASGLPYAIIVGTNGKIDATWMPSVASTRHACMLLAMRYHDTRRTKSFPT